MVYQFSMIETNVVYSQGEHTVLISKICPYFEVLCLSKYYCPHRRTRRGVGEGGRPPGLKIFRENSVFRASASCSKILNVKSIFNTVKNFRAHWFSGQAQSCSKILNGKKYIQYSDIFQGKLCFQDKRKLLKILNVKSAFNTVKIFRATLFFQGKRKLLKNRERWKNVQYSVYSLGGDLCNLG